MKNNKIIKSVIIICLLAVIIYTICNNINSENKMEIITDLEEFEDEKYNYESLNTNLQGAMNIINDTKVNDYKPNEISKDLSNLISKLDPISINKGNIIASYHKRLEDEINEINPELSLSEIPTTFIKNNNGIELELIPTKNSSDVIAHYNIVTPNGCLNHDGTQEDCDTTSNDQKFKIINVSNKEQYNSVLHSDNAKDYELTTLTFEDNPFNIIKVDCDDCNKVDHCLNIESSGNNHKIYLNKCDNTISQRFYV